MCFEPQSREQGDEKNPCAEVASHPGSVRFVSVEGGAGAFDALPPPGVDETVIVAQALGEQSSTFAVRAVEHVAAIERSGRVIAPAVLVPVSSLDRRLLAARAFVARALLTHMAASGSGELVLVAPGLDAAARAELLSLRESLLEEYANRGVTIRLQFRQPAAQPEVSRDAGTGGRSVRRNFERLSAAKGERA